LQPAVGISMPFDFCLNKTWGFEITWELL
jgi:hypothetical protein